MQTCRCACTLLAALPVLYIANCELTPVQQPGSFLAGASVYLISSGLVLLDLVGLSAGLPVKDDVDIPHWSESNGHSSQGVQFPATAQASNSITSCLISYLSNRANLLEL